MLVQCVDTGLQTGGRIKHLEAHLEDSETLCAMRAGHPGAAASQKEGMAETLIVTRLGI